MEVAQAHCSLYRFSRSGQGRERRSGSSPHYRDTSATFSATTSFAQPLFRPAFCAGFGFESPLFCDPFLGFGGCFLFFGLTVGFQSDSFSVKAETQDVVSGATDLGSTPAASTADGADHPITLLQLKNGWMYGLTDYWVEGDNLHYVTNYGGKNSVPLDLIDLATTIRLNSERGVEFSLHTKGRSTAQ